MKLLDDEELLILSTTEIGHSAAVEIRALRAAPPDERREMRWIWGHRQAYTSMLAHVLRELGYDDTEATRARTGATTTGMRISTCRISLTSIYGIT